MRLQFELTPDDLLEVQKQLLAVRRERMRRSPRVLLLAMALTAAIAWPLMRVVLGPDAPQLSFWYFGGLMVVAGLGVAVIQPFIPPVKLERLRSWSAQRLNRLAQAKSVFGAITVTLDDDALVRTNSVDTVRIPWAEVTRVMRSTTVLTAQLQGERRVIVIPRRAFPDPLTASAFEERLTTLAGGRVVDVSIT